MKTSTIVFGGFFITDNGERIQIPILENPNIKEINNFFLYQILKKAGVLVFRIIPEPEFGNTELTIYFEKGYYLPIIQTILEDGDIEVKILKQKIIVEIQWKFWETSTLLSISLKIFL